MAVSYGFFDGDTEYGQEEFNQYFDAFLRSGVKVEDADENGLYQMGLKVTTDGKNNITVASGMAILQGFWLKNSASMNFTLDRAQGTYARVVVRLDKSEGNLAILVKYSSNGFPELTRDEFVYEISLARATAMIRDNAIGPFQVYDERTDLDLCGSIRPRSVTEYDTIIKSEQDRWEAWFEEQQSDAKAQREIAIQATQPKEQVAGAIWFRTY